MVLQIRQLDSNFFSETQSICQFLKAKKKFGFCAKTLKFCRKRIDFKSPTL